jgi:hypothetical protein
MCARVPDIEAALEISPNEPAFTARRETILRALNRAAAFGADADNVGRTLAKGEDIASTAML